MSNKPRNRPARDAIKARPAADLQFRVRVAPPDGDRDPETGAPTPVDLFIDLRRFTLGERDLAMRAMRLMADPADWVEYCVIHAWVVWRRTHPTASLQTWMDHLTWGDILDGLSFDVDVPVFDVTPEGFDPKV